jgi:hypothetical protein
MICDDDVLKNPLGMLKGGSICVLTRNKTHLWFQLGWTTMEEIEFYGKHFFHSKNASRCSDLIGLIKYFLILSQCHFLICLKIYCFIKQEKFNQNKILFSTNRINRHSFLFSYRPAKSKQHCIIIREKFFNF